MYMKRRKTRRRTRRKRRRHTYRTRRKIRRRKKRSYKRQRGGNGAMNALKPKRFSTKPVAGNKCSSKGGCMNASWVRGEEGIPELTASFNKESESALATLME